MFKSYAPAPARVIRPAASIFRAARPEHAALESRRISAVSSPNYELSRDIGDFHTLACVDSDPPLSALTPLYNPQNYASQRSLENLECGGGCGICIQLRGSQVDCETQGAALRHVWNGCRLARVDHRRR